MTLRLIKIDEQLRLEHSYLEAGDACFALGEYVPGAVGVGLNSLITNFKKPMDRRERAGEWQYKQRAIREVAGLVQDCLSKKIASVATFVPIPPSRVRGDPLYDPRLVEALRLVQPALRIAELLVMRESSRAHHEYPRGERRPTPNELAARMALDSTAAEAPPSQIVVFDDVITNGTHFKAAQLLLRSKYPGVPLVGLFIARRRVRNEA